MNDEEFKKQVLEQFAAMNKRFDAVEAKLSEHDARFEKIDSRLDGIDSRLNGLGSRLNKLEASLADVGNDVQMVYEGLQAVLDQQEIEAKERAHITLVLNRHERWIAGLARHTKLTLSHD